MSKIKRGSRYKDLTGQRFGKLMIIEDTEERLRHHVVWKCLCDCGNIALVLSKDILRGHTTSCGCLSTRGYNSRGKHSRHGLCNKDGKMTREYRCWVDMNHRCYNKNNKRYKDYGGRGITVCYRWRAQKWGGHKNAFINFYKDMGEIPAGLSINRINNDGNYKPSNCEWATRKEQNNNKRKRSKSGSAKEKI